MEKESNESIEKNDEQLVVGNEKKSKSEMKYKLLAEKVGLPVEDIEERKYSKSYLKRILKNKKWEESKDERRRITKEKRKKKKKKSTRFTLPLKDSPNKVSIVIDLSLESYMRDRELKKLMKQLQRCYSINRRCAEPCQFYFTSLSGTFKDKLSKKQPGFQQWDVIAKESHFLEVFDTYKEKGNLIFLSSDSPNVLPAADEVKKTRNECVYVIGGLVDHNIYKGLTLKRAEEAGIRHARLPIDEYVQICMSKVLTVNHVFELMLLATCGIGWKEAFEQVIPQRKFKKTSTVSTSPSEEESDDD